jgi:hypothetical protein
VKRATSTYSVTPNLVSASVAEESGDVVASALSPSSNYVAKLRESTDQSVSGGKKRVVEIWSGVHLQASQDVTSRHRSFYTDGKLVLVATSSVTLIVP